MATKTFDQSLKDLDRRQINFREYQVENALPDFIVQTYPKVVSLLKKYYEFENEDTSPSRLLDELFHTRDISQADLKLLSFIEDEYLLGQAFFEGFADKRDAAKYSNTLYRSKGTKYSIAQFFKTFFGIDPDIIYTKEQVFTVGEDKIGAESQRFITDDKLYQKYAILIKSELSLAQWKDSYKLFVHPAGMYLGAEVQIVGSAKFDNLQYDPGEALRPPYEIEGSADFEEKAYSMHTALFDMGATNSEGEVLKFRTTMGSSNDGTAPAGNDLYDFADVSIGSIDNIYSSLGELLEPNSPTLDDDDYTESDSGSRFSSISGSGFDLSSLETIDQAQFTWQFNGYADSGNTQLLNGAGTALFVGDSDSEITMNELKKI